MDKEEVDLTYDRLRELLDGFDPRTYSGRFMCGRLCLSVETRDEERPMSLLADIIEGCKSVPEATEVVRDARTDSMGLGTVIYWPGVEVPEGVTLGDDDEG